MAFLSYIDEKKINGDIKRSSYGHLNELINYWYKYGTWKVPIIVMDSSEFDEGDYRLPFQLVEGHNNESDSKLADYHKIWFVKKMKSFISSFNTYCFCYSITL